MAWLIPGVDLTEIGHQVVRREPCVLVVPADDPLAKGPAVALESVGSRPFVAPIRGTAMRELLDGAFGRAGIEPRFAIETNEVAAAVAYVGLGAGLTILTRSVVEHFKESVATVPLTDGWTFVTALAWHEGAYRTPAAERALSFARAPLEAEAGHLEQGGTPNAAS